MKQGEDLTFLSLKLKLEILKSITIATPNVISSFKFHLLVFVLIFSNNLIY